MSYRDECGSAKQRMQEAERALENLFQCGFCDQQLANPLFEAADSAKLEYIRQLHAV
jgi:hypothetical protein